MKTLSKLLCAVASLAITATAVAQNNPLEYPFADQHSRNDIIIPKINGLNVYKADFHLHTIYSDGDVTPEMRVIEAWRDGLDIIAITDHMEYRRIERSMYRYMKDYIREDLRGLSKAVNTNVLKADPDSLGLLVDFNVPHELAVNKAKDYGIHVIRGVEITRNQGHYNAIFTQDNNKIYDPDIRKAIKNAVRQAIFFIETGINNDISIFAEDYDVKKMIADAEKMYRE